MASFEFLATILTGLGLTASIVYYASILRNANKSREAQVFLQFSNRMADNRFIEGLKNIRDIDSSTFVDFILKEHTKDSVNREKWMNIWYIMMSFEDLGGFVRGGFLGISIIALTTSGPIIDVWEKLAPHIVEFREKSNNNRWGSELEYLYNEIIKYRKEHPELNT